MMQTTGNKADYYRAWAQMMVTIWEDRIVAQGVRDTGALLSSFKAEVVMQANGDVSKIVHSYLYYGRMVDMGVGRGISSGESQKESTRKRKPWYNKAYYRSIQILIEKTAAMYGEQFQAILFETLKN